MDDQYAAARDAGMGKMSSDCLGQLFLTMGKKSTIEVLKLPGLSLPLRLKTAIEARYLKHALLCFQAIASGCRRPETVVRLPEFRETLRDKPTTPTRVRMHALPTCHHLIDTLFSLLMPARQLRVRFRERPTLPKCLPICTLLCQAIRSIGVFH